MKARFLLTVSLVFLALHAFSQHRIAPESLDSLRASFVVDADEMVGEFEAYAREAERRYQHYAAQMEADYRHFAHQVARVWGTDSLGHIVEDSQHEWVEYGPHYRSRSKVNFETGRVVVEVVLDSKEAKDSLKQTNRLAEAIQQLLQSRGSSCPYESKVDRGEPLTMQPVLQGLLDFSPYAELNELSADAVGSAVGVLANSRPTPPRPQVRGGELAVRREASRKDAEQPVAHGGKPTATPAVRVHAKRNNGKSMASRIIAEQSVKRLSSVTGSDGEVRQVVAVEMRLVTDNLSKNAALYKDLVAEFSNRFQVEQPLIYAVIEQESYFNPEATSWVPAYGLMQLVPTSGGRHAYRYVYGKDWCPTRSYLFNPRNNIELGTAYLRVLLNQFAAVGNTDCRRLCAIASYNTGAGNVSRAFTGGTSVTQATPLINRMDYNALYNHLTTRLSHSEARNYVAGVTRRMAKYVKQD